MIRRSDIILADCCVFHLSNLKKYAKVKKMKQSDSITKKKSSNATIKNFEINPEKQYNPYDHRNVEHPNSDIGSFGHLLKCSLGCGILAMPSAFKNSGMLFGIVGTLVVGFICTHCVHLVVKCSYELSIKAKVPSMSYAETADAAFKYGPEKLKKFGPFSKIFVDVLLATTHSSGTCVFIVLIADAADQLLAYYKPEYRLAITTYMWILFVPLVLYSQIRELKYLVPFSMMANIFLGTALIIIVYYMFRQIDNISHRDLYTSVPQLPIFFSTALFAMEGIGIVMPVENNMKKPQHFLGCPGVLNFAMGTVVCLYGFIGFFGYLAYGENTAANISMSLDIKEIPAQIAKICIPIASFFTYALQFYIPIDIIMNKLVKPRTAEKYHNVLQISIRTFMVFLTILVAVLIKDLENLIGLIGSICLSTVGIMVPVIMETVLYWNEGLGKFNWILIKNVIFFTIAVIALIAGSYTSIAGIIRANENYNS